jgi:hypothetical protein
LAYRKKSPGNYNPGHGQLNNSLNSDNLHVLDWGSAGQELTVRQEAARIIFRM